MHPANSTLRQPEFVRLQQLDHELARCPSTTPWKLAGTPSSPHCSPAGSVCCVSPEVGEFYRYQPMRYRSFSMYYPAIDGGEGDMDVRISAICVCVLLMSPSLGSAQQIRAATGPAPKPIPSAPKAAYNSMAKTTTPFNCQELAWPNHPHPGMKAYCERLEAQTLSDEARRAGRPEPSDSVVSLPSLGSEEFKRSGSACIGGQAFRKLPNGWAQISSPDGGWQRCRER